MLNKLRGFLKNELGLSMVQGMVLAGIVAGGALVTTKLMVEQKQAMKSAETRDQIEDVHNLLTGFLKDKDNCRQTMVEHGLHITLGDSVVSHDITKIRGKNSGDIIAEVGETYLTNNVLIQSMTLKSPTEGTRDLEILYERLDESETKRTKRGMGAKHIRKSIPLRIQKSAAGDFESCYVVSDATEDKANETESLNKSGEDLSKQMCEEMVAGATDPAFYWDESKSLCVPNTKCPGDKIYAGIDEQGNRICKNIKDWVNFGEILSTETAECPTDSLVGFQIDGANKQVKVNCTITNDTTPPSIVSFSPAAGKRISPPTQVLVTFSELMKPETVTNAANWSMTCTNGGSYSVSSVTLSGLVATVNLSGSMPTSGTCTFIASSAITDKFNNALVGGLQVIYDIDKTPPTIASRTPAANAQNVERTTFVTVTFSEAMNPATITNSTFTISGRSASVSYNASTNTATLIPSTNLSYETSYSVTLSGSITDVAGNALSASSWSFTTEKEPDTTAPVISSFSPVAQVFSVGNMPMQVTANFSEAMKASTVTTAGNWAVACTGAGSFTVSSVTLSGQVASINLSGSKTTAGTCTLTAATGIQDLAGNALGGTRTVTYTFGVEIALYTSTRYYSDGTFARTCKEYLTPATLSVYTYSGSTGNGTYRIDPDGAGAIAPLDVTCDMTSGGWTQFTTALNTTTTTGYVRNNPSTSLDLVTPAVSAAYTAVANLSAQQAVSYTVSFNGATTMYSCPYLGGLLDYEISCSIDPWNGAWAFTSVNAAGSLSNQPSPFACHYVSTSTVSARSGAIHCSQYWWWYEDGDPYPEGNEYCSSIGYISFVSNGSGGCGEDNYCDGYYYTARVSVNQRGGSCYNNTTSDLVTSTVTDCSLTVRFLNSGTTVLHTPISAQSTANSTTTANFNLTGSGGVNKIQTQTTCSNSGSNPTGNIKFSSATATFKPAGATLPVISYAGASGTTVAANASMNVNPTTLNNNGAAISNCTSTPALPTGITINATTCKISGISTVAVATATYTIRAINSAGTGQTTVQLTITPPPPTISYASSSGTTGNIGVAMSVTPSTLNDSGSSISGCSISPALPSPLSIHNTTCVISGIPSATLSLTNYTVTATNSGGSSSTSVSLRVNAGAPTVSYTGSSGTSAMVNTLMSVIPSVSTNGSDVTNCTVSPSLPSGLSIGATSCIISGIPTVVTSTTTYTVTVTNTSGSNTGTVSLTVTPPAPTLSYAGATGTNGSKNSPMSVTPTTLDANGGTITGCFTSPGLPAGLTISPTTCVISGTPSNSLTSRTYTVSVTSNGGTSTADVTLSVSSEPTLSYAAGTNRGELATLMTVTPTLSENGSSITSCTISPALPGGLSINNTTCVISGTPNGTVKATVYTVTATNSSGSITASVTLAVTINCPSNYIAVFKNPALGVTQDFCVAKYEMRNVAGLASSQATNAPWVSVTASAAQTACTSLGATYDLISNPEWMTVAREVEAVGSNWSTGTSGSGILARGWSANTSSDSWTNTSASSSAASSCLYNTGANACSSTGSHTYRRTLTLSTGDEIWDFSGNIMEWVDWNQTISGFQLGPTSCTGTYVELSTVSCAALSSDQFRPKGSTLTSANGIGKFIGGAGGVTRRGGHQDMGSSAGAFSIFLNATSATVDANTEIGFRCVQRPVLSPTISYVNAAGSVNAAISVAPQALYTNGAAITNCTISPSLPGGLSIYNTTCVISGTPSAILSPTEYTVTATNSAGSSTAKVTLSVISCPANFVAVAKNTSVGTDDDFCVMKYEAKNDGSGNAVSQASGNPYDNISASTASSKCSGLGDRYDLISNSEWMTLARNIESFGSNWSSGYVEYGYLSRGWVANTSNGDSWTNTTFATSTGSSCVYNTAANSCSSSGNHVYKRIHTLSSGEDIWDISGNAWEWVDWNKNQSGFQVGPQNCSGSWTEFSNFNCSSLNPIDYLPFLSTGSSAHNLGKIFGGGGGNAIRGGYWATGTDAGPFTLFLYYSSTDTRSGIGFRCVYRPYVNIAPIFSYSGATGTTGKIGESMSVSPTSFDNGGEALSSCTTSPALPSGLSINNSTCVISGTPSAQLVATTYTVTATNTKGSGTATVSLTVNIPPTISYAASTGTTGTAGSAMSVTPSTLNNNGSAVTACTISPALPSPLQINNTTCVISGIPSSSLSTTSYTITATNAGGSSTANVSLTVNSGLPTISISPSSVTGSVSVLLTITPTVVSNGATTTCSITAGGALPSGVTLNASTCVISGTPTATKAETTYTITATNSAGSASATVSLTVEPYIVRITQYTGYRAWSDGTFAISCNHYKNPIDPFSYTGSTGDGIYRIDPDGAGATAPFNVYCDMTTDGGGWTLCLNSRFTSSASALFTASYSKIYPPSGDPLGYYDFCPQDMGTYLFTLANVSGSNFIPQTATVKLTNATSYNASGEWTNVGVQTTASNVVWINNPLPTQLASYTGSYVLNFYEYINPAYRGLRGFKRGILELHIVNSGNSCCGNMIAMGSGCNYASCSSWQWDTDTVPVWSAWTWNVTSTIGMGNNSWSYGPIRKDRTQVYYRPAVAPTISFSGSTPTIGTVGVALSVTPTVASNGASTTCSITAGGALPAGLTLNSSSCAITGTPTAVKAQTTYTITATNSAGSSTGTISLTINPNTPVVTFSNTYTGASGTALTITPTMDDRGAAVTSCSITPALPGTLTLNNTTCAITGTPSAVLSETQYTVRATNSVGQGPASSFYLMINVGRPVVTYSASYTGTVGSALTITPTITTNGGSVSECSISPALPSPLTVNSTTCQITGTPTSSLSATTYSVSVRNSAGWNTPAATFSLTINGIAPTISYSGSTGTTGAIGDPMSVTPTTLNNGGLTISACTSSPALPSGLSVTAPSCVISGTPTATSAATNYTITATNSVGSATATVSITINARTPFINLNAGNTSSYPGTGTSWTDLTNSWVATMTNGASYTSSAGGGISFDGVDDFALITPTRAYRPYGLEFWIKTNCNILANETAACGPPGYSYQSLIGYSSYPIGINLGAWTSIISNEVIHINSNTAYTYTNQQLNTGLYHLFVNWNGSSYDIWLNGVKQTAIASTQGHSALLASTTSSIWLGATANQTNAYNFWGNIYEFRLWNSQLPDSEVTSQFNSTSARFKPTLSYPAITSTIGSLIETTPTLDNKGSPITNCTISPALPSPLTISTTSCMISGTPTSTLVATTYTVTATNAIGTGSATVTITVNPGTPVLTFLSSYSGTVGTALTITPTINNRGAAVTSCSITPALPGTLTLDNTTCAITGTPSAVLSETQYTVRATNSVGQGPAATFYLSVNAGRPVVTYSASYTGTVGTALTITPTVTTNGSSVFECSTSPALPASLTMSQTTCAITGTPTAVLSNTSYTVTARNGAGTNTQSSTFSLSIAAGVPVISFASSSGMNGYLNTLMSVTPSTLDNRGSTITACTSTPSLPSYLTMTAPNCVITGTPTSTLTSTAYSITATNSAGTSAATSVTLSVTIPNVVNNGTYRSWANGAFADSCHSYRNPSASFSYTGATGDGVYRIDADGAGAMTPFDALCDMTTEGGGWTVFQRRSSSAQSFYQTWASYAAGFGSASGDYWLGNDRINYMTSTARVMRVDISRTNGNTAHAKYSSFRINNSVSKYSLAVSGYSGTAGDSLVYHSGRNFSTYDSDNDSYAGNCAANYYGGWWYGDCHYSNLNGLYGTNSSAGVVWYHYVTVHNESLSTSKMMIRPHLTPTLSYSGSTGTSGISGTSMTVTPTTSNNEATSCSSSPSLPAGLSLSVPNCVISGTPESFLASTSYTITAINPTGSTTANVTLSVIAKPVLSYSASYTGIVGTALNIAPSITTNGSAVTSCSISPQPPSPLVFNSPACTITGTPSATLAATTYSVTATNGAGTSTAVTFTLTNIAKPTLSYSSATGTQNSPMSVSPASINNNGSAITSCAPVTALPAGLSVSSPGCVISGTPTVTITATAYTIRATNSAGSTDASVTLTISPNTVTISQFSGYRGWGNNTLARTCYEYRYPTAPYQYSGVTGDGVYRIDPDGAGAIAAADVTCEMSTGGWTVIKPTNPNGFNSTSYDTNTSTSIHCNGYIGCVGGYGGGYWGPGVRHYYSGPGINVVFTMTSSFAAAVYNLSNSRQVKWWIFGGDGHTGCTLNFAGTSYAGGDRYVTTNAFGSATSYSFSASTSCSGNPYFYYVTSELRYNNI